MIVVRKGLLILIGAFSIVFLIGSGISGFFIIGAGGNLSHAEIFLFWTVVAAIFLLLILIGVVTHAQSLNRRLDRLIEQGSRRDIVPGRDFQVLGILGERLTTIFNQVSRQNYLKSQKISAMRDLIEFLVRNEGQPVSVCDILGTIHYASDAMGAYLNTERLEILGQNIDELLPEVSFTEVRSGILKTRQPKSEDSGDRSYACYPIEDNSGNVSYLVFLFNGKAHYFKKSDKNERTTSSRSTMVSNRISWFLNRKGRQSK